MSQGYLSNVSVVSVKLGGWLIDQVISTKHVLAAAFRAINDVRSGRMKSKNVHAEMVYSLGANNNVRVARKGFLGSRLCLYPLPA